MLILQVSTNAAIGLAYLAISLTLAWLVYRIRDLPFRAMYLAFGVFIVTCGLTHFLDVWVIWHPHYWVDGGLRAVTALASVITAVALPPLMPKAEALARSYEKARELDQIKTAFFANASHELRTPLTLILGPTERLLSREDLPPEVARELEVIRRNARTLLHHVEDLLDISKLEAGQFRTEYASVDLAELSREAMSHFDALAAERQVNVRLELPETLPAELDPRQIERVLLNLLANAFRFAPLGGHVRLSLSLRGDEAHLEVADDGPGIPEPMRAAVFERFRQVEGQRAGGTGLGLAISRDLVQLHRGAIEVAQAPEGGAQLAVRLPRKAPEGAQVRAREPATESPRVAVLDELRTTPLPSPAAGERPRVLVVEDHPDLIRFVAEGLSDRYVVDCASDGREGLRKLAAHPPDLVVTDLMMPGLGGEQLVRELRAAGSRVPLLVLSAVVDGDRRIALLQAGADDYLLKPFRLEELRARVQRLVSDKLAREVLQGELAGREGDLVELTQQLARASQLKTAFLRMITHELRTPVHVLQLQLQLAWRDPSRAPALLSRQQRTLARLGEMIDALLLHARIEAGALELEEQQVELGALVRELVTANTGEAGERGLELVADAQVVHAVLDTRLLRLVLQNLVSNAVKFTPAGRVTLRASESEREWLVEVQDTGLGIASEDQARVFLPFEQVEDAAHKHVPGMGLGLSLVQEFTRAMGGQIRLTSAPGRGSTFTIALPRRSS